MMPRHLLISVAGLAALVGAAEAQQPHRERMLGVLAIGATRLSDPVYDDLRKGLRELGHVEGSGFRIEFRSAEGRLDRLPRLAQELVRRNVDVILTGTDEATRAAKQATSTIPIVAVLYNHDPVALGFIQSFSRPGGNITGLTVRNTELAAKRLELLKDILPGLSRVAVFWDSYGLGELEVLKPAARSLGVQLQLMELKPPYDLEAAFESAKAQRAGAVMVLTSPQFFASSERLGALALKHRVPASSVFHKLIAAGGLVSYSIDPAEGLHRAAYFVDRLLKGAKAAELPFEEISNPKLVVNLRSAKTLGIAIPEAILLQADEVIR